MNKISNGSHLEHTDKYTEIRTIGVVQGCLSRLDQLSDRQREVLRLVAAGATNKQICSRLGIAGPTVENHIKELKYRLRIDSRSLLAIIGYFDVISVVRRDDFQEPECEPLLHAEAAGPATPSIESHWW